MAREKREITVRQFLEAALIFSDSTECKVCQKGQIELVWLDGGNEKEPIIWYLHCNNPACEREYTYSYAFVPDDEIPEGD